MTNLVLASLFFLGIHFGISSSPLRTRLVAWLGEGPYLGLFSAASLGGIVWMSMAYESGSDFAFEPWLYAPPVLMLLASFMVVASFMTPSPLAVGQTRPDNPTVVQGILKVSRHPQLWGFALWAVAHMLANPDPASLVFFGTFLVLAVGGSYALDAKKRALWGEEAWSSFAAATSNIPLLAVIRRRQNLDLGISAALQAAIALLLYVLLAVIHPWVFGVPAIHHG